MAEQMVQDAAVQAIPAGYKQTEVGVIPEDWDVSSMSSLTSLMTNGFVGTAKTHYTDADDGVVYIQGYNVEENGFNFRGIKKVTAEFHQKNSKSRLRAGDLLMVQTGGVGLVTIIPPCLEGANCHALIINRFRSEYDPAFFSYLFNSQQGRMRLKELETGTTMKHINVGDLLNFVVSFPRKKQEQTAIANVLSDSDALIGALEQLIAKKQAIKSATMQQLLTGRTRLPAFALRHDGTKKCYKPSELGEIPEDWEVVEMAKLGSFGRGRVISHTEINKSYAKLYPVYSSQTSNDGIMGYLDSFSFDGEFVTWTTDGVNAGKVFYRNGKFNCTNVCGVIKIKDACARYVAISMDQEARKYVSTNLANPKLMNGVAKQVLVRMPNDVEEQTAIATILSDMDNELQALTQKLEKARALKQGMMQQLLTGKIRLPLPPNTTPGASDAN